jgi:hypothetical protein
VIGQQGDIGQEIRHIENNLAREYRSKLRSSL